MGTGRGLLDPAGAPRRNHRAGLGEGLDWIDNAYAEWSIGLDRLDDAALLRPSAGPPGTLDGRFPFADVMLHVNREIIHHGAEVALLRDLYRATSR